MVLFGDCDSNGHARSERLGNGPTIWGGGGRGGGNFLSQTPCLDFKTPFHASPLGLWVKRYTRSEGWAYGAEEEAADKEGVGGRDVPEAHPEEARAGSSIEWVRVVGDERGYEGRGNRQFEGF